MAESNTPDLGQVISVLMQNPEIIEKISTLLKGADNESGTAQTAEDRVEIPISESALASAGEASEKAPQNSFPPRQSDRSRLLSAFKPYVSEGRRAALDTLIGASGILDMIKSR